ncbi:MAG: flagellar basal body P-ring protein FlgI [Myxococcales bacterium]|nr:flagellar basal body P-ring protein FlgI [Myxococcales bacterium]
MLVVQPLLVDCAMAARLKEIANVKGVRENPLIGYGLIVGLAGTGDKSGTEFTIQSLTSMLAKMGIALDPSQIKVKNVAAVMVTARLPAFARTGNRFDVTVASLGDSTSLAGGTLLMTPLLGSDGKIYAIAQGAVSVGGFSSGGSRRGVQKNHPTVGRVANGATVEREIQFEISGLSVFEVNLNQPDFTTSVRTARVINAHFGEAIADAVSSGSIVVRVPESFAKHVVRFLSEVEMLNVEPDRVAKVILNERTGTVVMGAGVMISTVAIAHGGLTVTISSKKEASQPSALALGGETVVVENTDVEVYEEDARLNIVESTVTIGELVRGLNAMGISPRDLIAIMQAVKAAGALTAELEVM